MPGSLHVGELVEMSGIEPLGPKRPLYRRLQRRTGLHLRGADGGSRTHKHLALDQAGMPVPVTSAFVKELVRRPGVEPGLARF